MKQSLVKLVDAILKHIEEQPEGAQNESLLRSWLAGQGYNKRDIDAAMKLVRPRFLSPASIEPYRPGPLRVLSPQEEQKLSCEARDALVRLELYGLISMYERELLLDHLNHFEAEIGLDELDYLLSWLVCSTRDVESQQTIYGVLEGQSSTLH